LSGANAYTGTTTINGATLALSGSGSIAPSSLVSVFGTFDIAGTTAGSSITTLFGSGNVTMGSKTLTISNGGTTYSGAIGGTGGLTLNFGTQTLSGSNTYTGATTINGGTLALSGSGSVASSSQINVANAAGTFDISGTTTGAAVTTLNGVANSHVTLGAKTLTISNGSTTYAGIIGGAGGGLTLTAGTETLSGVNTYTGTTTINGGTLVAANASALGSTAGGTTVGNGGTLNINGAAIGNEAVTLNGAGVGSNGALTATGTASLGGVIALATDSTIGAATGADVLTLSGTVNGASALNIAGAGSVTFGNTVGATTALTSLSQGASNALNINGGLVRTVGAQTYSGTVATSGATVLTSTGGGNISAINTGNSFSGDLSLNAGGIVDVVNSTALSLGVSSVGSLTAKSQSGNLTLNGAITATNTGANAVTLVADVAATPNATGTGGNFINNAGAAAITTGAGGAWRIYTGNPTGTVRGGLVEAGKRYNVDDGSDPLASGNRIYFRVQPTLTLTADNQTKTYGAANPVFTFSASGLIDGDTALTAVSSGPSYAVDGTLSTSGNLTAGTLHNITPSAAASNLGYSLGYASGTLTVNKLALTGAAIAGVTTTYGTPAATGAVSFTNAVVGDVVNASSSATIVSPTLSTSLNLNAGTYKQAVVAGLSGADAGNYSFGGFTTATNNYTVNQLALTGAITAGNKIYDATNVATITGRSLTGAVVGDVVTYSGGTATFSDQNAAPGKVVTETGLVLAGTDAGNYSVNSTALTSANITPAALTISANNASRNFGVANPAFSASYSGFAGSDSPVVLTGTINFTTPATVFSPIGAYVIVPSGQSSTNYSISYVNGTLTILPPGSGTGGGSTLLPVPTQLSALQTLGVKSYAELWRDCLAGGKAGGGGGVAGGAQMGCGGGGPVTMELPRATGR
jgi:autotransporter-associated beta strand protein